MQQSQLYLLNYMYFIFTAKVERIIKLTLLFLYHSLFFIGTGKKSLKKFCQRNSKKTSYLYLSLLFLPLERTLLEKPQLKAQRSVTLFPVTDNWILELHFKHSKWKLIDGIERFATTERGHRLQRIWIQCRKSNGIQQEHSTKFGRLSCSHMLQVFTATEGATTGDYMWASILQRMHRTTDKWKVIYLYLKCVSQKILTPVYFHCHCKIKL